MRRTLLQSVLALLLAHSASAADTYTNPLVGGAEMADPHVLRVGETYYMYPTSQHRGYEVFTSKNLVDWRNGGMVFHDRRTGTWAPDVFHFARGDGKFYLYYTDTDPEPLPAAHPKQIGVAVSDSPRGPFVDKGVLVRGCIDAHLYQDDDGELYLYYVSISSGFKIMVQAMSDPLTTAGEPSELIHPSEPWEMADGEVTEGPWMLKRDGTYYLMYSGSGADTPKYAIGYATAKSPLGPFTKFAGNPIVHGGDGVFGPGHHSVVEGPDRKLWMLYHQKFTDDGSFDRFLALDPLWFDDQGVIHARVTRGTPQSRPQLMKSGVRQPVLQR